MESFFDLIIFRDMVIVLWDKGSDIYFFNLNGRLDFGLVY